MNLGLGEIPCRDRIAGRGAAALQPFHLDRQIEDDIGERTVLELGACPPQQPLCLIAEA
jgi:hypothetical protein